MTMDEYLRLDALSASTCHNILEYSPAHALYWKTHDNERTETSETGVAIHDALLEGIDRITPIDFPDWRKKEARELRDFTRQQGGIPMLAHRVPQVEAAVKAAKACISASPLAGLFDTGQPEVTIQWDEGGLPCKCRPDWLADPAGTMLHVKTTKGSANPEGWSRTQLVPMGYDVAWAFYRRAMQAAEQPCYFLVIEQEAPHGCSIVTLDAAMAAIASAKVERAIAIWRRCKETGRYPGYPTGIYVAEPKPWMLAEEERAQIGGAYDALAADQA